MSFHQPASRISGRYQVAGRPLLGGMGIVYVCLDLEDDRPVALKTLRPEYLPDRAARDRFLREGTHWVELGCHPNIVRCYQVFRTDVGDQVYLVLELVAREQGREDASLRAWLTPGVPLPVEQALLFALQISWGMQHAVDTIPSFVHRDLKPENVLVGADRLSGTLVNRLRLTDFGLAAALEGAKISSQWSVVGDQEREHSAGLARTQLTQGIVGTPLYVAPEQWRGGAVSTATDIYALGCILYEMLVGRRAVAGGGLAAVRRAHCEGQRRPLPGRVAVEVGEVVACCLAVEPEERYGSWEAVGMALRAAYEEVVGRPAPAPIRVVAPSRDERVACGWSSNAMGLSYLDMGKAEVAVGYFERARSVGEAEGEHSLVGAALGNLGGAHANLGDARQAISYHKQCLTIHRELEDRRGEGNALGNLGLAYACLGDARQAIGCYEQHLETACQIEDRRGEGNALGNLAHTRA